MSGGSRSVRPGRADIRFVEVFVDAPLHVCERRDVKGLYARARAGGLDGFTGVSAPYETPEDAHVVVRTDECTPEQGVTQIVAALRRHSLLPACAGQI